MTSTTGSKTLLIVLPLISICLDVNSDLIVKPKDAEAMVGGRTFFNCSTTLASAEIHWFHYAIGDTKDRSFVYGYEQFYSPYLGRFQMEKNSVTGAYNLIISSVTIDDAGRYECQDDIGRGDKDSAQLTVLGENLVCQSNMKPVGFIGPNICGFEPEELHLTCAVQYYGNQPPIMQWKDVKSDNPITEGVTQNISSNRAIYYLKMEINSHMDGSAYHCETTRSATSQYGCTSDVVSVKGFSQTYVIIICVLVGLGVIIISAIAGFGVGRIQRDHKMRQKDSTKHEQQPPTSKKPEQIELIEPQVADRETIEKLTTENKRLLAKVNELEQLMYSADNKGNKTAANLVHTIDTKAAERDTPITGMTILENHLFVVKKNCPIVEVYDSKTFVFERLIENLQFTNPLDIASSKEDKFVYVFNRENESTNKILKFKITGERDKMWEIENDIGRLSTYESNLIVCFCTKRIIVEYSPEGETVNTIRLSPGSGFYNIWHAVKLTGSHFVVSHSKGKDGQRVCVVDINGKVLAAFEELPNIVLDKIFSKACLPICLVGHRNESVLVADARYKRVLLLSPKELEYEGVLLETDKDQTPVRLCLNETKDRLFVGVNSGDYSKSETWKGGRILIYNVRK